MFAFDRKTHLSKHWFLYGIVCSILLALIYPELGLKEGHARKDDDLDGERNNQASSLLGPLRPEWTVKFLGTIVIFLFNGCSIRSEVTCRERERGSQVHSFERLGTLPNGTAISNSCAHPSVLVWHLSGAVRLSVEHLSAVHSSKSNCHRVAFHPCSYRLHSFIIDIYAESKLWELCHRPYRLLPLLCAPSAATMSVRLDREREKNA